MKRYILLTIFLMLMAFGCDRYVDSKDPVRSNPEDGPVPTNVSVEVDDSSITLIWQINDPGSSVIKYYIYISEAESGPFTLYDSTTVTEASLTDLDINIIYYFNIVPVFSGGVEGEQSETVSAQFSFISMTIADNKEYVNSRNVFIRFTAPFSTTHMILSEDMSFADAEYETYTAQKSFNITSDGDGLKTIYAKLQFSDGSTTGDILSDDITLDTEVRIDSVFFLSDDSTFVPGDTIIFGLDAGEEDGKASVSFSGASNLSLYDDGTHYDNIADDGIYYGWYLVPNGTNLFNETVTGNFTDRASNRASSVTSFERLNINTAPEAVTLSAYKSADSDSVYFNWTSSTASDFVNYRLFKDVSSSSVDTNDVVIFEAYNQSSTSFVYPTEVGTTYFRIYVYDQHGSIAGSNVISINN